MGHGGPRAPRVRPALQLPCQPPSLASPLLPHSCAREQQPTARPAEERTHRLRRSRCQRDSRCGAGGRGSSEIVWGLRGRNILGHFCHAGWAPASSSPRPGGPPVPQRAGCLGGSALTFLGRPGSFHKERRKMQRSSWCCPVKGRERRRPRRACIHPDVWVGVPG